MKIILSRKGFDSSPKCGKIPSPILPDKTLLSMPIPGESDNGLRYSQIKFGNKTYLEIWRELTNNDNLPDAYCHLDPDIRKNVRISSVKNWSAAFGQVEIAQSHLERQNVSEGDLFLFFGRFRMANETKGKLTYDINFSDKHIIYGYLQIGKIINNFEEINKNYVWHPHSSDSYIGTNNTLYVAADELVIDKYHTGLPGFGTFKYKDELELTKDNYKLSIWDLNKLNFLKNPETNMSYHLKREKRINLEDEVLYSVSRGQEFVVSENEEVTEWAKNLIINNTH